MPLAADSLPAPEAAAAEYANKLLTDLGCAQAVVPAPQPEHAALSWARSGLMMLTGSDQPLMCPAPIAACADGAIEALKSFGNKELNGLSGSGLLTERAALMGLSRGGRTAAGGSCRILEAADGRLAINLAREDDWAMMPAWLESEEIDGDPGQWDKIASVVCNKQADALVAQGRLLGLPVAKDEISASDDWCQVLVQGTAALPKKNPLVLDLSALWAGPLCSHLLQKLGARVIKVESSTRPDGGRQGNTDFYDLLNAGKESLQLDLKDAEGREQLLGLIAQADIVIEAARPRGLQQLGIDAEAIVQQQPGLTWLSITAYGREGEAAGWVGFGDDVGVAAGLSSLMQRVTGESVFVGDAIADPLTGIHAALAAWAHYQQGGGRLISVAMRDVVSQCLHFDLPLLSLNDEPLRARYCDWAAIPAEEDIQTPQPRAAGLPAAELGAHTQDILAEFGLV